MTFEEARAQFPVLERIAYLNAGTFGPLASATVEAMRDALERDLRDGRTGMPYFEAAMGLRAELRERFARLVGAEPEQVALTSSTTDGCNVVVAGLGLGPGDEIVTTTDEHFGLLGPIGACPARVVVASPDPERILAAVSPRTRLIAISEVLWTTGAELPVAEIRAAAGVPVLVDGAQAVGARETRLEGVDFLAFPGQKWLCGPDATGALAVADPDRLSIARPSYFAQRTYEPDGSFEPRESAERFEPGWWSTAALRGMRAALDARPTWAHERAAATTAAFRAALEARVEVATPAAAGGTLVAFRPEDEEPSACVARLLEAGVSVRELPGRGLVRASVGWWTSDGDLERLLAALDAA